MRHILTTPVPDWRRNAPPGVPLSLICPPETSLERPRPSAAKVAVSSDPIERVIQPSSRNRWRSMMARQYTPEQVEYLLHNALAGDLTSQWELFDLMEDTWPRLVKCLNEVKGAVVSMDWRIEPWAEEDVAPAQSAKDRASLVSHCLWSMRPASDEFANGFEETIYDVTDAWAKGLAVLEIDWERKATKKHGDIVAPRGTFWVHPVQYGWSSDLSFIGIRETQNTPSSPGWSTKSNVLPFPEHKFIVAHRRSRSGPPLSSALLRPLAWWWCASTFTSSWFLNFAQIFGLPIRWATYDPSRPGLFEKVCDMLENMGSSAWGAFPTGTALELKEASKSGTDNPQTALLEMADKQCDLIILGQTLTTDVSDSGSRALGSVHMSVRDDVIINAGSWAARVIQDHMVRSICVLNYGDDDECPQLIAEPHEVKDETANAQRDQIILASGVAMPRKWFYARHDIPLPAAGEETIGGSAPVAPLEPEPPQDGDAPGDSDGDEPQDDPSQARAAATVEPAVAVDDIVRAALAQSTGARKKWLAPLNDEIRRLAAVAADPKLRDEDVMRLIEAGRRRLPELFGEMDQQALAGSITAALGSSALAGAKDRL